MTFLRTFRTLAAAAALALSFLPGAAGAQGGLFAPAVYVNDRVITQYEVEQYRLFLGLLRQPGDLGEMAVERLIEDALRRDAARAAGVSVSPEELQAGLEEFAGRANLSAEQFTQAIGQSGVAPETFRSFVESGLLWRQVVRARFGSRAEVSDADVDRALATTTPRGGVQVLLSELVLRADTPAFAAQAEEIAARLAGRNMSEDAFAAEARNRSASASRGRGGRLDWLPIGNLPPQIAGQVVGLSPGQVSQPFPTGNALVLFLLRDIRETGAPAQQALSVEWAEYVVASRSEAERVKARVDTCDDLYGVAKGQPAERLRRETRASAEVPGDVAAELAQLDAGEVATGFSRGGQPVLLMLCGRSYGIAEGEGGADREQVRGELLNQRLSSYAEAYLAELRADATIRRP